MTYERLTKTVAMMIDLYFSKMPLLLKLKYIIHIIVQHIYNIIHYHREYSIITRQKHIIISFIGKRI